MHRKGNPECRSLAERACCCDAPLKTPDDGVADPQSKACALPDFLRREKRFEHFGEIVVRNAASIILYDDTNIFDIHRCGHHDLPLDTVIGLNGAVPL